MSNPLGDLISKGEGGYNSFNRGNAGDAGGETIDFSQLTLGQVQAEQHLGRSDPNRLFAVGKYQIIPDTMDDAVKRLKLDPDQKFTPALQEHIFADYLIAGKRPAIEAYIKSEPCAALHAAQTRVLLRPLLERSNDMETVLGGDRITTALEGHALLKLSGKGAELDQARQALSARFASRRCKTTTTLTAGT